MKVLNKRTDDCSGAVYVGRPSKWGNPFEIGKDGTREEVITKYKLWLFENYDLLSDIDELKGKDLSCWCSPKLCHANVLMQLANE